MECGGNRWAAPLWLAGIAARTHHRGGGGPWFKRQSSGTGPSQSGVALRFPPHSMCQAAPYFLSEASYLPRQKTVMQPKLRPNAQ